MTIGKKIKKIAAATLIAASTLMPYSIARADEAEIQAIQSQITRVDTQKASLEAKLAEAKAKDEAEKEAIENRLASVRLRTEYTSKGENTNLRTSTVGVSLGKSDPKSPFLKFDEDIRLYNTQGTLNGGEYESTQYNVLFQAPKLKSKLYVYGEESSLQFADHGVESEGIGAQYIYDNGKLLVSFFGDQRTDDKWEIRYHELTIPKELTKTEEDITLTIPEKAQWEETSTHIGGYFDYEMGKWVVGAGFDRVESPSGTETSALVKARFFPTDNDQFGVAFHTSNNGESTTNTVAGTYGHYGKDLKWGGRAIGVYSWNNEEDRHNLEVKLRLTQNPTFGRDFPFEWVTTNMPDQGGQFLNQTIKNPFDLENYDPHYHTKGGAFGELKIHLGDDKGIVSGSFSAEGGYKWTPVKNSQLALSGIFKHEFTAGDLEDIQARDTVGAKLYLQKGRYELQLKADQTMGENPDTSLYGSVQVQFGIPKPNIVDVFNGTYVPKGKRN